jgi:hypothetical protein
VWRRATFGLEVGLIKKRLDKIAARCPANHGHRAALVEAEWRRYQGRASQALPLCAEAIAMADAAGDLRIGGLARELLAEAHIESGRDGEAKTYILQARERYQQWNAAGVVVALERRYPDVFRPTHAGTALPSPENTR